MRVMTVIGTRPEAIKMAPVISELDAQNIDNLVCFSGQHVEMVEPFRELFGLRVDRQLNVMQEGQGLNALLAKIVAQFDQLLAETQPTVVLAQGDTTTALGAAIAAFHRGVDVGHVEAGLRSNDLTQPWPEEFNRVLIDQFAQYLFPPTPLSAENLAGTPHHQPTTLVTGNTVVDAVMDVSRQLEAGDLSAEPIWDALPGFDRARPYVLLTAHRRENHGQGILNICEAVRRLARDTDQQFIYPVHLNPAIRDVVTGALGDEPNVFLHPPVGYLEMVDLMRGATFVVTDSGGLQEEAPTFGKPVILLRENTERPEGVLAGTTILAGTDVEKIVGLGRRLLDDKAFYSAMARRANPYGDGQAAQRIVACLKGETPSPFKPEAADALV